MITVLLLIHFFIAAALVGVILIQRSEGGALGGLGGGTMGGMMTARGSANLLTHVTTVLGAAFFAMSLLLGVMFRSGGVQKSIVDIDDDQPTLTEPVEKPVEAPVEKSIPPPVPTKTEE